jgi:hypothetical protein
VTAKTTKDMPSSHKVRIVIATHVRLCAAPSPIIDPWQVGAVQKSVSAAAKATMAAAAPPILSTYAPPPPPPPPFSPLSTLPPQLPAAVRIRAGTDGHASRDIRCPGPPQQHHPEPAAVDVAAAAAALRSRAGLLVRLQQCLCPRNVAPRCLVEVIVPLR